MYGFSINCQFKPELPFREVWRALEKDWLIKAFDLVPKFGPLAG